MYLVLVLTSNGGIVMMSKLKFSMHLGGLKKDECLKFMAFGCLTILGFDVTEWVLLEIQLQGSWQQVSYGIRYT